MREILFRGKRADNDEWAYGDLISTVELLYENTKIINNKGLQVYVYPETVGQYTGLKDKNGKRIFEGDILSGAWDKKLIVYFDEDYLQFRAKEIGVCLANSIDYYCIDKIEVIGNIYDNTELLRGYDK